MRLLVTGSSGTIGTRLCERIITDGHDVIGIDWTPNVWRPAIEAHTLHHDLRKTDWMGKALAGIDMVIHLAAHPRVSDVIKDPTLAGDNILMMFNVLEWMRRSGTRNIMFASSREVYGNSAREVYNEDMVDVCRCGNPYAASKLAGETLVYAYSRCYGLNYVVCRFSDVYGMYDTSDRVIPLFIRRARKNDQLLIYGRDKRLDFTYIDDIVHAIMLTIHKFEAARNDTYNIATGIGTSILHVAEEIKKLTGSASPMDIHEPRTVEAVHFIADITKARTKIGYQPCVSFEDGIRKTIEWYKQWQDE